MSGQSNTDGMIALNFNMQKARQIGGPLCYLASAQMPRD
ncbi:hypothetical protein IMCC12053_1394 [Celeribacter marinus]|uniref:Uncharacterized protein n=1 Tax=Celeribacter marinus TaxID=1397108 RepID=A0A0N7HII8_9RHOB|nr:hypothetical protein IMCC12053_1394 [Celeribacter marinus]